MHPSLEQLLDHRDGESDLQVANHVAECPDCAAELERLRALAEALRSLPDAPAGRDLWPELRARIVKRRRDARNAWVGGAVAAASVAAVLVAGVLGLVPGLRRSDLGKGTPGTSGKHVARSRITGPAPGGATPSAPGARGTQDLRGPQAGDSATDLARLIRQSQRLEALLIRVDSQPRLESGLEAAAITRLQDRVAVVDGRIAQTRGTGRSADLVGLWKQRVALLDALVRVQAGAAATAAI